MDKVDRHLYYKTLSGTILVTKVYLIDSFIEETRVFIISLLDRTTRRFITWSWSNRFSDFNGQSPSVEATATERFIGFYLVGENMSPP